MATACYARRSSSAVVGENLDNKRGETWEMLRPSGPKPKGRISWKGGVRIRHKKPSRPPNKSQLLAVLVTLIALLVVLELNLESTHAAAVLVAVLGVARLLLRK
jgi:hypothetical protein